MEHEIEYLEDWQGIFDPKGILCIIFCEDWRRKDIHPNPIIIRNINDEDIVKLFGAVNTQENYILRDKTLETFKEWRIGK